MGDMVKRAEYAWGNRIEFPEPEEGKEDQYRNLRGMVAMGPPSQSQFMSFRVVSVNSPPGAWIHPGIKARHYLQQIIERGSEQIEGVIHDALAKDLGL
jgi:hypothetical protein